MGGSRELSERSVCPRILCKNAGAYCSLAQLWIYIRNILISIET